ncbi:hypothetical protein M0Q97_04540 [Candidatus Dojkabacteria bacterium]|jgi:hypothetical protein|nr:hypothetical protein [Candidatus Dojkabacteria bacterium]
MEEKKEEIVKKVKVRHVFKTEDDILTFGINSGKTIGVVMQKDPNYVDWCVKKVKGFKLYKKLALRFEEIKKERLEKKTNEK